MYPGGPMNMAGPSTFTGQPMQGGMFGRQGPYGGAMGTNPIMRMIGVLGHAQGGFNPTLGAQQTPEQHGGGGFNPMMLLSPLAFLAAKHPNALSFLSPGLGLMGAFK